MDHTHKTIAGVCLIAAPLLLLVEIVIDPLTDTGSEVAMLRDTAAHPDRFYIATLLSFAAMVAFVPATLGLMHMLRERSPRLALAGGGLALLGVMTIAALFVGSSLMQREMVEGAAAPGQM